MPTDLTGAPTSQGIGTYNTSVDAPSGLGFNAAMGQIDGLLAARTKALTTTGDLLYASAANTPARLPIGTTNQVLTVVGGVPIWAPSAGAVTLRKTTPTVVNTTVAATDLLGAAITLGAGAMGTTGLVRLTAYGNFLQNSGGAAAPPRWQLVLGGTTIIDTGTSGTLANSANRGSFKIVVEILNSTASAQTTSFQLYLATQGGLATTIVNAFTTGEGLMVAQGGASNWNVVAQGDNTTAIATAGALALVLNVINGSASATYETKLLGALVEVI